MTSNELHLDNFSGNHYNMGVQQGELYEKRIDEALSRDGNWWSMLGPRFFQNLSFSG
jgi:hypothetical protein